MVVQKHPMDCSAASYVLERAYCDDDPKHNDEDEYALILCAEERPRSTRDVLRYLLHLWDLVKEGVVT